MRVFLRNLLACCLLFCLMLAPARAEMPSSPEERYAQELSLLNSYLQNGVMSEGLDIRGIYDTFARNGNIGEHATGFRGYVQALALIEDGDFAGARAAMESLQDSVSYAAFRAYLEDGEDLRSRGLYAIRPLNELEAYMLARECEAQGQYAQAVGYYDQCLNFFDTYDRLSYAASVTPAPTPTPSPTPVPTPAPSNILASRFWERFSDVDAVRAYTQEIRFLATLHDAPASAVDVSQKRDGSVRAWFVGNVLYIAANGMIYAPEDSSYLFSFYSDSGEVLTSLETIDFGNCFDTSNVANMSGMFANCLSLTNLDLSGFDTGNVTDMSDMFYYCKSLTELDVSGFDTSNVTDMAAMFASCNNLTELDVSGFDTSNVTDMSWMFYDCENLTELDVSGFDTGNVTDMSRMFYSCKRLTALDVSGFDTSNVTNMSRMFYSCKRLTALDVSGFDTGNVTDMWSMFAHCSSLTELDVSGFDTGNVTGMSEMFAYCENLTKLDVSGFDTSNVTDMSYMFSNCYNLTKLDVSGFDISNVTDMSDMFSNCYNLTKLDVSGFDTGNVTDMSHMFSGCPAGEGLAW